MSHNDLPADSEKARPAKPGKSKQPLKDSLGRRGFIAAGGVAGLASAAAHSPSSESGSLGSTAGGPIRSSGMKSLRMPQGTYRILLCAFLFLGFLVGSTPVAYAQEADAAVAPPGPMRTHSLYGGAEARGQWPNSTHYAWPEIPSPDRNNLEVWGYTDATSYAAGDVVLLHVSTTAAQFDLTVMRDGGTSEVVLEQKGLAGQWHPTPKNAFDNGPGWPVGHQIAIPDSWKCGGYVITRSMTGEDGQRIEQEAVFILRAKNPSPGAIAFVAATGTWQAYNERLGWCQLLRRPGRT